MYPVDEDENFIQNISKNISFFFFLTCISFTLKPLKSAHGNNNQKVLVLRIKTLFKYKNKLWSGHVSN